MFYGSNCDRKSQLSGILTESLNPREPGGGGTKGQLSRAHRKNFFFVPSPQTFLRARKMCIISKKLA